MRLVRTEFKHIHLPLIEDNDRKLYATTKVLGLALAVPEKTLLNLFDRYKGRLQGLRSCRQDLTEFLKQNRVEFGIKEVRGNMLLWSISDISFAASHIKTPESDQFRIVLEELIADNIKSYLVTAEQHAVLVAKLADQEVRHNALLEEVGEMRNLLQQAQPALKQVASAAGAALNAQKQVRRLQLVK